MEGSVQEPRRCVTQEEIDNKDSVAYRVLNRPQAGCSEPLREAVSREAAITAQGLVPYWGDSRDTEETVPGPPARLWEAFTPAVALSQESARHPLSVSSSLSEAIVSLHQILEGLLGTSHLPLLPRLQIRPPKAKGVAFGHGREGRSLCFPAPSMAEHCDGPPPVVAGMEEERGPSRSTGDIRHGVTRGLRKVSLLPVSLGSPPVTCAGLLRHMWARQGEALYLR